MRVYGGDSHSLLCCRECQHETSTLTEDLDRAVEKRVNSGRDENASEVFRAAFRALEREERDLKGGRKSTD